MRGSTGPRTAKEPRYQVAYHTYLASRGRLSYMLQTNCKLDQFVNRPLVFKLVGPLSIIQSELVLFINQAEWFESWLIGLEAR